MIDWTGHQEQKVPLINDYLFMQIKGILLANINLKQNSKALHSKY